MISQLAVTYKTGAFPWIIMVSQSSMSLIPFADQEQVISSSPVLDPLKVDPSLAALTIVSVSAEAVTPGPLDVGATISAPIQPVSRAPTPDELRARYSEIPSHASEWFVVTQGRMPGVYHTW